MAAAPRFRYDSPDGPHLDGIVAEYESITGVSAARTGKRNLVATCYRTHGPGFLPLVTRLFTDRGTETNLLGIIRSMRPEDEDPTATDAGHEALAGHELHAPGPAVSAPVLDGSGRYPGLTYGPEDRPAFDPTSKRRYDRRPSNPDAASFFDLDDLAGPSPTSRALSR